MAELDKIIPALAAAIGSVHKVAKTGRNTHDGYNFAGIDDFLALVNPICAEHGLFVHIEEAEREDFMRKGKFGENAWMRQAFTFTLYHASGQSMPTVRRTVEVLRNGAQAYGSAQSYALKQFLRGALLIPTGDKDDADLRATDDGVVISKGNPKKEHHEAIHGFDDDFDPQPDTAAIRDRLKAAIAKRTTKQALEVLFRDEAEARATLKRKDPAKFAEVMAAFKDAGAKAHDDKALQAPIAEDEIPY